MALTTTERQRAKLRAKLRAWRKDPVLFCTEVLGFEPWHCDDIACDTQRDILVSAALGTRVAIRSGHKCGKSKLCAALALWEFVCWPGSRTIITAPTYRQIDEVIWREIRDLHQNARIPIGGELALLPGKGLRHHTLKTQVFGFATNESDRFSGLSGPRITYILDEASGISPAIYQAIAGNRMGGARLILISNPTQPTGEFYDAFHSKAGFYARHHISSVQLANAVEAGKVRRVKGLADADVVREFELEWGAGSDEFNVRAEGEFASQGALSVIRAGDYDSARNRWAPVAPEWAGHRLELGLDVARFGDDASVIVGRRGRHVLAPVGHQGLDGHELAMKVWNFCQEHRTAMDQASPAHRPRVRVEVVGVGASAFDALNHNFGRWLDVVPYDPSTAATESSKFVNLRAEAWFHARRALATGPWALPEHSRMRTEALAVHYKYDDRNRIKIERKEDIKKRLNGKSPDYADALVIALWDPPEEFSKALHIRGL